MSIQRNRTGLAHNTAFRLLAIALLFFSFAGVAAADETPNDIKVERVRRDRAIALRRGA